MIESDDLLTGRGDHLDEYQITTQFDTKTDYLSTESDYLSTGSDTHLTGSDDPFLENQNYNPIRTPKVMTFDRK